MVRKISSNRNVFRHLKNAIEHVREQVEVFKRDPKFHQQELYKLNALNEIKDYVYGCSWLTNEKTKLRVQNFLIHDLNYKKVASLLNTSQNALEVTISYANKIVKEKIGENTIQLILDGYVDTAMTQFRISVGRYNVMGLVLTEILGMLPEGELLPNISVADCKQELVFLKTLTYKNISDVLDRLSKERLTFLRYVLESNDSDYSFHRDMIARYLSGEELYTTSNEEGKKQIDILIELIRSISIYE